MNTKFPGRPDYTGPISGLFGLLHHDTLFEESNNVMRRVKYVRRTKPKTEVSIRLWNMIYLDPGEVPAIAKIAQARAEYERTITAVWAEYARIIAPVQAERISATELVGYKRIVTPARAEYARISITALEDCKRVKATARADILAYIRTQIPDCAWDGKGLVF